MFDKTVMEKLFGLGVSLVVKLLWNFLSLDSDIGAEKAIIDGSICIPQPRLARFSILLVSLFGKLMFSKSSCKLWLSLMNKFIPN